MTGFRSFLYTLAKLMGDEDVFDIKQGVVEVTLKLLDSRGKKATQG